jgi:hypothetical protein
VLQYDNGVISHYTLLSIVRRVFCKQTGILTDEENEERAKALKRFEMLFTEVLGDTIL